MRLDREQHDLLDDLRHADPALRQRLARQWRAFIDAQLRDLASGGASGSAA